MIGKSTKQVAQILGVGLPRLSHAVWRGAIAEPEKGPGNSYCWMEADLNRASQVLLGKPYKKE